MKLYNDYNSYLKEKFGVKVYRIGVDAGFSCPNRDGSKSRGGCLYCDSNGSRSSYTDTKLSVPEQLKRRIEYLRKAKAAEKFIAYFQAFTNTYAPVAELKKTYDSVLSFNDIVGISIGTRPDAVDREKIELIASYKGRYEVWIEYGLQSAHDRTLRYLNRGHTWAEFLEALKLAKAAGIKTCCHVILGLPGESREDMIKTAHALSDLGIDGIKIHLLHILKGSPLERLYNDGKVRLFTQDEYINTVCDFLEVLSPDTIVQRLTAQGTNANHIAPAWAMDKIATINKITEELKKRGSCQGSKRHGTAILQNRPL